MNVRMATYDGTVEQEHQRAEDVNTVVRVPLPEGFVANPRTAEVIDLGNAENVELAAFLDGLEESRVAIQDAKRIVSQEVLRRMDQAASWTLRADLYQLRTASPEPVEMFGEQRKVEYQDGSALRDALYELVDEGLVTAGAVDSAVETIVLYKVRRAGVKALRKLGGKVAEVIDRHAFKAERRRYVSVDRVGRG